MKFKFSVEGVEFKPLKNLAKSKEIPVALLSRMARHVLTQLQNDIQRARFLGGKEPPTLTKMVRVEITKNRISFDFSKFYANFIRQGIEAEVIDYINNATKAGRILALPKNMSFKWGTDGVEVQGIKPRPAGSLHTCRSTCRYYEMENPRNDCPECYGTGNVGGYDGPYQLIISPSDTARRKAWTPQGYVHLKSEEVWTGRDPVLAHWDFIVKHNNERFSIGGVRTPTARGARLQQHFEVNLIPDSDIRYKIPIAGQTEVVPIADTAYISSIGDPDHPEPVPPIPDPATLTDASPVITEKPDVPEDKRRKGRTVTYDDIMY